MDHFSQIATNGLITMQPRMQEAEAVLQLRNLLTAIAQGQLKVVAADTPKDEPKAKK